MFLGPVLDRFSTAGCAVLVALVDGLGVSVNVRGSMAFIG